MKQGLVHIVQGGQFGSEGKGQVAAVVAKRRGIQYVVRTGSINAGHTVLHEESGERVKMQIIPTAWVNAGTMLYLGPGTYIHRGILNDECEMIYKITGEDIRPRLVIDYRCSVMGGDEATASQGSGRHHTMGATGKGCSEAVISRLRDRGNPEQWKFRMFASDAEGYQIGDVPKLLNEIYHREGEQILLEGTQGSHLDFLLGPWPFTTNRSCNSAAWMAEAGIPSNWRQNIIMVCRTFPIRVAGNSGPLSHEIEWSQLGVETHERLEKLGLPSHINIQSLMEFVKIQRQLLDEIYPQAPAKSFSKYTSDEKFAWREAISEIPTKAFKSLHKIVQGDLKWVEMTTVTKKIRRIGRLSISDLRESCRWNNPDEIIMTFMNYPYPELGHEPLFRPEVSEFLMNIQNGLGRKITAVTTGPDPKHQLDITVTNGEESQ